MLSKKGVSEVVTVILIILISIAAVVILWNVIRPMIKGTADSIQSGCLAMDLEVTSCDVNAETVVVQRNTGGGVLAGIKLSIEDSTGDTEIIDCNQDEAKLKELETKTIALSDCDETPIILANYKVTVAGVLASGPCDLSTTPATCVCTPDCSGGTGSDDSCGGVCP